jgi:hypothetical protein
MRIPKISTVVLSTVAVFFVVLIVGIVASSLVRPELETYVPTPVAPEEVAERSVALRLFTVDASAHDRWIYFDFSRGSVVDVGSRRSLDWDIAFQRHRMITNGGATNPLGQAGILDLGPIEIDSAVRLPETGYVTDEQRGDTPRNRLLEDWYDYAWTSHVLRPADRTFALRTADGKYALLRFVAYYCPGGRPGCVTFRYRYRGDGARAFSGGDM